MDEPATRAGDDRRGSRLRARLSVVTVRGLVLAFALALAGAVGGGFVPLLGAVGSLAGLLAAAFALGLAGGRRRYAEVGVAGAVVGGVVTLVGSLGPLVLPLVADYGVALGGAGAGAGLGVSLVGHYLGRDLRAGLTRDL